MKIGLPVPANLLAFADEEAKRLEAEQIQAQSRQYIHQHGWDVADDEGNWRRYQQARMAEEYRADDW